jgi:hypothetical protein
VNAKGNTECVVFVQQATDAPDTELWIKGIKVIDAPEGKIERLTAIATFHDGKYPTDDKGKHAAIYLSHDPNGIWVLDQWNSQGCVKKRKIRSKVSEGTIRSNDANWFYVIG